MLDHPPHGVTPPDEAGHHHLRIAPAQVEAETFARVDESKRLVPEAGRELGAPSVGLCRDLDDGRSDLQPSPCGSRSALRSRST